LAWTSVVLAVSYRDLTRPWLAIALVTLAFSFTALTTAWLRSGPEQLLTRPVLVAELAIAVALIVGNGWAYGTDTVSASRSIGSIWPLAAVLSVGVASGTAVGAAAGLLLGVARYGADLAAGVRQFDGDRLLSITNTAALYIVAGAVAGYVAALLRRAEREISASRAREELARDLHDGVLQTLAVIQRRADDAELVRLAREQDRDLRRFLFGGGRLHADQADDLAATLRSVAAQFEDRFGVRADVLVPFDLPPLDEPRIAGISRAVGEALTNAGKHARARHVTIFVEADDDDRLFCSVKDDGVGFDATAETGGVGIRRSIVDRMHEIGGRADVRSTPGGGTEVCLWL
jgi:signal transduction histidine kinase